MAINVVKEAQYCVFTCDTGVALSGAVTLPNNALLIIAEQFGICKLAGLTLARTMFGELTGWQPWL